MDRLTAVFEVTRFLRFSASSILRYIGAGQRWRNLRTLTYQRYCVYICTLSVKFQHRIMRNIHLLFCQGTDFYRSPCLIREMHRRQEKLSFRDARTWIMILNHRGKRFLCRWTQCRRSSHLYFFLSSATPPAFCFHFFVLPRFFFSLSLSLSCLFFRFVLLSLPTRGKTGNTRVLRPTTGRCRQIFRAENYGCSLDIC